jgi:hypothetical protein
MDFISGCSSSPSEKNLPFLLEEVQDSYKKYRHTSPMISDLMLLIASNEAFKYNQESERLKNDHIDVTNSKLKAMDECYQRIYNEAKRCYTNSLSMNINIRSIVEFEYSPDITDDDKINLWKKHNPELMYVIDFFITDLINKDFRPELKVSYAPACYNGECKPYIDFHCNFTSVIIRCR